MNYGSLSSVGSACEEKKKEINIDVICILNYLERLVGKTVVGLLPVFLIFFFFLLFHTSA